MEGRIIQIAAMGESGVYATLFALTDKGVIYRKLYNDTWVQVPTTQIINK